VWNNTLVKLQSVFIGVSKAISTPDNNIHICYPLEKHNNKIKYIKYLRFISQKVESCIQTRHIFFQKQSLYSAGGRDFRI